MRSVGEALSLGRTALEALNKAIRASERNFEGLTDMREKGKYSNEEIDHIMHSAHPLRLMSAYTMLVKKVRPFSPSFPE